MSVEEDRDASIREALDKDICPDCGAVIQTYAGGGKACTAQCGFWWVW